MSAAEQIAIELKDKLEYAISDMADGDKIDTTLKVVVELLERCVITPIFEEANENESADWGYDIDEQYYQIVISTINNLLDELGLGDVSIDV